MQMSRKSTPTWSHIKRELAGVDKAELLEIIHTLYEYSDDNRLLLAARSPAKGDRDAIREEYRTKIVEQFYPTRGFAKVKLAEARRAIRDYRKASGDLAGALDLMLTYLEVGTRFANEWGVDDQKLYDSLISVLDEVVKLLTTSEGSQQYGQFRDRLLAVSRDAKNIGYGYGDYVEEVVQELEERLGQE
jgi:hypothetical protein